MRRSRLPLAATCLALLLGASACSSDDPVVQGGGPATGAPPVEAPPAAAPEDGQRIGLRGDGLDISAGGPLIALRFGSSTRAEVESAMTRALGVQVAGAAVECGQGARIALGADGFDVLLDGEVMVGWDESGGESRDLATSSGVRLGSTRAEVAAALPDAVFSEDTLGPEFSSDSGLGGFLDGATPDARVVGLYGGETCVAR